MARHKGDSFFWAWRRYLGQTMSIDQMLDATACYLSRLEIPIPTDAPPESGAVDNGAQQAAGTQLETAPDPQ